MQREVNVSEGNTRTYHRIYLFGDLMFAGGVPFAQMSRSHILTLRIRVGGHPTNIVFQDASVEEDSIKIPHTQIRGLQQQGEDFI